MPDEFAQYVRKSDDEFAQYKRSTTPSGAGGSWTPNPPEGTVHKVWRVANTPLVPEGRAETEGHAVAESPVALSETSEQHPTLASMRAAAKRGAAGMYADTLETARGFTTPLAIATLGIGKLASVPGATGKIAGTVSKIAGVGFGAQGAEKGAEGVYDMSKHGVTPSNLRQSLSGAGQAIIGATAVGGKETQGYLTERLPQRMINQLIRPSAADVKFGKNPAQAILEEKIVGNSLPEIGDRVFDRLREVGQDIDRTVRSPQNASKVIDTSSSLKPIDDAMQEAMKAGDRPLFVRLGALKQQLTMNWQQPVGPLKAGQNPTIKPTSPRTLVMSPYEATQFKRVVGDATKWTGIDPFENQLNAVKGEIYGKLKQQINQTVPEVAPLNERYSNLVSAGKAIERRIPVAERNSHWSLSDIALGASGHVPLAIARKVVSTPAVRSRVAVQLNSLAPK